MSASHGQHSSSTTNLVGVHYRVGKKIGEGSFGVIFEGIWIMLFNFLYRPAYFPLFSILGTNLLNSQTVAIKFVCTRAACSDFTAFQSIFRNPANPTHPSFAMNVGRIVFLLVVVSALIGVAGTQGTVLKFSRVYSRHSADIPLRSRRFTQHPCHRLTGSQS